MLVDAVVVDDRDITCAPVVTDIVVDLVPLAVQNVEGSLIHVPVFLRFPAGTILFEVQVERLSDPVLWFDVVARVCLWAIDHF